MKKMVGTFAVIILASGIAGCAVGNKGAVHYNRTTTIGQELIDLKEAKEKGALSEKEYNEVRKDLLESGSLKISGPQDKNQEDCKY